MTAAVEARENGSRSSRSPPIFSVTTRWIESQQALGLPYMRMRGMNRYVLSEVEAWMREQYSKPRAEAAWGRKKWVGTHESLETFNQPRHAA
jgi:hypothetical protein